MGSHGVSENEDGSYYWILIILTISYHPLARDMVLCPEEGGLSHQNMNCAFVSSMVTLTPFIREVHNYPYLSSPYEVYIQGVWLNI